MVPLSIPTLRLPHPARRFLIILAYILAIVMPPLLAGVGTLVVRASGLDIGAAPPFNQALPAPPVHDPAKRTAVIVASNHGTEISDFLPPYELLARSGAFNVYVVAPERRLTPITSAQQKPTGLELIPHYSYADYERAIGRAPDLIVVPFLTSYQSDPAKDAPVVAWLKDHTDPTTTVLTICAGSAVFADTGLLDGRTATSFHRLIPRLETWYPGVRWVRDVRWVDDGNIISAGSLASGIDATLHTLERLVGREVAERVAREVNYPHTRYLDDAAFAYPANFDLGTVPNVAYTWGTTDVGVALYDGVSELALAAVLDPYAVSIVRTYTVAPERAVITSRHGLSLVPRAGFADAPTLARVLVPGKPEAAILAAIEGWAQSRYGLAAETLAAEGMFAYDATVQAIARRDGRAMALGATANLLYPTGHLVVDAPAWPLGVLLRPVLLALPGLAVVVWAARRRVAGWIGFWRTAGKRFARA